MARCTDPPVVVERAVDLPVGAGRVWRRVTTPAGIGDELAPWLRMTTPRGLRGATIAEVGVGVPLGRAWVLLGGVLPVEYDDLCLDEVGPSDFRERSSTALLRRWEHHRTVVAVGPDASRVTDRLRAVPRGPVGRVPGATRVVAAVVGLLFDHRHRRLRRWAGCDVGTPERRWRRR